MTGDEKFVLDNARDRAARCDDDAALFGRAAERCRVYAYYGDQDGDLADDETLVKAMRAMTVAENAATATARKIRQQMVAHRAYKDWLEEGMRQITG